MKNVLLLVDTRNLLHSLHHTHKSGKLDYQAYIAKAVGDDILYSAKAYGSPLTDKPSAKFRTMLKAQGFDLVFKDPIVRPDHTGKEEKFFISHDVDIAVDALTICRSGKIERVVIGSNSVEYVPLIQELKRQNIRVEVFACRVQRIIRDVANSVTEIDESLLFTNTQ